MARTAWSPTDVILHHLGVGAAGRSPADLRYVYERDLVVLPSFATVLAQDAARSLVSALPLGMDPAMLVQGEHELVCLRPIDPEGVADSTAWVESVWGRSGFTVLVVRVDTASASGEPLAINRYHLLLPGHDGFDEERGAAPRKLCSPARAAGGARMLATSVLSHQAAVFRLTGDRSPAAHRSGRRAVGRLSGSSAGRSVHLRHRPATCDRRARGWGRRLLRRVPSPLHRTRLSRRPARGVRRRRRCGLGPPDLGGPAPGPCAGEGATAAAPRWRAGGRGDPTCGSHGGECSDVTIS